MMNKLKPTNRLLVTITIVVYIIVLLIYGFWDYSYRKNEIIKNIDIELYNSAIALKYILPENLHDRAIDQQSISTKEDKYIAHKLTEFIKETGFKHIYTIIKKADKLFFVASDIVANPETERGTFYYYQYEEADESFINAFDKETPTYKIVTDQWGTVRTVMIPEISPGGVKYLACADYDISYVEGVLKKNLVRSIATVFFFLLCSVPIIIIYTKLHGKHLNTLRESEEKYRTVLEANPDPVVVYDMEGKVIYFNLAFTLVFGWSLEERFGKKLDLFVPEKAWKETKMMIGRVLAGEGFSGIETYRYNKDEEIIPVSISGAIYKDQNGNPIGSIINLRDISAQKNMETQLQQAQKMEAIGTLAGGIAHDFNNILSGILGYSELVLADLPTDASIRNKLEAIHSSGERARDLVGQILAFSRKDEQSRSPVDVHLILEESLKLLRPAIPTTIEIQTRISSDCRIFGDPSRVHQIIMNLCTNAYQAMLETGGTLEISLSKIKMDGKAAVFAQVPPGFYGKLVIADTGVGIPSKNLERIFDPYFTTKEKGKGTGLGLAAVHGIVKSHGGAILVESQIGKGTRFEVYLPLTLDRSDAEKQDKSPIVGGNERILRVDDEHDILEVETEILKKQGYSVTAIDNAREALELFCKHPDRFDLVITDMSMPNMSGDKLAAELRKIRSDIPIIISTGFSELMSEEKANALGIKGFLMKPVLSKELLNMIRNVLDGKVS